MADCSVSFNRAPGPARGMNWNAETIFEKGLERNMCMQRKYDSTKFSISINLVSFPHRAELDGKSFVLQV